MAGIYIHIPFCTGKCPYCDFYSVPFSPSFERPYLDALLHEIHMMARKQEVSCLGFDSMYIGGGTPVVLESQSLVTIIETVRREFFLFKEPFEITVEANPESVEPGMFRKLRKAGVNRISIGIQDFHERGLEQLGRRHSSEQALRSVEIVREAGFDNISVDLIYGWPGQSLEDWQNTLETALSLDVQHLSCYELTPEENTPFGRLVGSGKAVMPPDDILALFTDTTEKLLLERGFEQYEISNFSRRGYRCVHNMHYWRNEPCIGFGAGAVSYLPAVRTKNVADVNRYTVSVLSGSVNLEYCEKLGREAAFRETVILGLRMNEGVSLSGIKGKWGIDPLEYYAGILPPLIEDGFLKVDAGRLFLSTRGRRLANQIMSRLV